jgi:hypothetical protein
MSSDIRPARRWIDHEVARLDPDKDYARIVDLVINWRDSDPLFVHLLYCFSFIRQVADPDMAAIVNRGGKGKLVTASARRANDTLHHFGLWWQHGLNSQITRDSVARMNAMHGRFPITNEQFLYTLATVVLIADDIRRLVGLPPRPAREMAALVRFWQEAAGAMGLRDIPEDHAAFVRFRDSYESRHFRPSPEGQACAEALVDDFATRWFADNPARGRTLALALFDDRLKAVFRFDYPGPVKTRLVRGALYLKGVAARYRRQPATPRNVAESFRPA